MTSFTVASAIALAAVLASPVRAQHPTRGGAGHRSSHGTATVEGDVYLMMQSGDVKRGAGRTVFLLRDDSAVRDSMRTRCMRSVEEQRSLLTWRQALLDTETIARNGGPGAPSIYDVLNREQRIDKGLAQSRVEARTSVLNALASAIVDTTGTGMNAHYKFSREAAGQYVVFGEWELGGNDHVWWAPVVLRTGESARRDLDNSAIVDASILCAPPTNSAP